MPTSRPTDAGWAEIDALVALLVLALAAGAIAFAAGTSSRAAIKLGIALEKGLEALAHTARIIAEAAGR